MPFSAKEIAELVGGKLQGRPDLTIESAAPIDQAQAQHLSFAADQKSLKLLDQSCAGLLILNDGTPCDAKRTVIFVENAQFAFAQVMQLFAKQKPAVVEGICASAQISKEAKLGAGVCVGANAVIEAGAQIQDGSTIGALCYVGRNARVGKNCFLYPQVTLREEVVLEDNVIVHSGAVIGCDGFGYVFKNGKHHKIPQLGIVYIESDVEIGSNVTIDRATMGQTRIGKGSKIDNLVQIAHNVQIGQNCILVAQAGIAGSSKLGNFVTIAGQVGIVGHLTIGDRAIVAAQSGVSNDIEPGAIMFGSPARAIQEERRIQVLVSKLPKIYDELKKIKKILKLEK